MDWVLVAATLGLCLAGALSVYAATRNGLQMRGLSPTGYLKRDLINVVVGAVLASPALLIDYRRLRAFAPLLYGAVCLALIAVLTPLGTQINGAHGWFSFGSVQLEPSEFAKIAVILLMAGLVAERRDGYTQSANREVLLAIAAAGLPMVLILAEPALGITIVIAAIAIAVLAVGGAPARWVGGLLLLAVVGAVLAVSLHLLKPYQIQRFTAFTQPGQVKTSLGYQMRQSQIAIGSGGLRGQGFLEGSQTNGGFIPEQQTDFVFTVAAEESGFAGGATVLALLGVLFWRGLRIAQRAPDLFGRATAAGVVAWLAFQAFVNVGMTLGIMPVTGLPLPFLSYGGSAMFADLVAIALLLNIGWRSAPSLRRG